MGIFVEGYWDKNPSRQFQAAFFNEHGLCRTFNPINSNLIFRNDTVDPAFLNQYLIQNSGTDPHFWDIETGYAPNRIKYYPIRTLDKGIENGFYAYLLVKEDMIHRIDPLCSKDSQITRIALHHPADATSNIKNFMSVPFNKSVTLFVDPKITTTSNDLRSYGSSV